MEIQTATSEAERERAYLASLRPFYHPVATCEALDGVGVNVHGLPRVLSAEVLGQRIVVARLGGEVVAMRGTCPHRGASLALGWLNADRSAVVCRYHGFEWGAGGRLQRIPAFDVDRRPVPTGPGWCVETYPTVVAHGLIWVCLEPSPRLPVLAAPPTDDPAYARLSPIVEQEWRAGCGRIVEAFMDTYHFPFTHWGSLGDPTQPAAPKAETAVHDDHFYLEYAAQQPNTQAVNYGSAAASRNGDAAEAFLLSTYRMWAVPNAVYFLKTTGDIRFGILAAVCPVGPKHCKLFRVLYASRNWDADPDRLRRTQDAINAEDREVVESARPWELSTDLDAELQTYVDRPGVTFRRWLASLDVTFM